MEDTVTQPAEPTPRVIEVPAARSSGCPPWCDQLSGGGHTVHVRNIARLAVGPFEVQVWISQDSGAPSVLVSVPLGDDETVAKLDAASARSLAVVLLAEDPGHPLGEALVKAAVLADAREGAE